MARRRKACPKGMHYIVKKGKRGKKHFARTKKGVKALKARLGKGARSRKC